MKTYHDTVMNHRLDTRWEERTWSKYKQYGLLVTYWPGMNMHHELGFIKQTNDSRWRWTLKDSTDNRFKLPEAVDKVQGVCNTKEEAMTKLETLWKLTEAN